MDADARPVIAAARPVPDTTAHAHAWCPSGLSRHCQGMMVLGDGDCLKCGVVHVIGRMKNYKCTTTAGNVVPASIRPSPICTTPLVQRSQARRRADTRPSRRRAVRRRPPRGGFGCLVHRRRGSGCPACAIGHHCSCPGALMPHQLGQDLSGDPGSLRRLLRRPTRPRLRARAGVGSMTASLIR